MIAEDNVFPGRGDGLKYIAAGLGLEHWPTNPSVASRCKPQTCGAICRIDAGDCERAEREHLDMAVKVLRSGREAVSRGKGQGRDRTNGGQTTCSQTSCRRG